MQHCWRWIFCVKIHLLSSGDIQCLALHWITLICNRFTGEHPPDLWIFAADFTYQKAVMKCTALFGEFFSPCSRVKMDCAAGTLLRRFYLLLGVLLHLLGYALPVTLIIFANSFSIGCSPCVGVRSACFFAFSSMKNAPLYEKSSKFTFSYWMSCLLVLCLV